MPCATSASRAGKPTSSHPLTAMTRSEYRQQLTNFPLFALDTAEQQLSAHVFA